jgi:hypothetical protein
MPLFLNQLFMKKIFIALLAIAAGRAEAQHLLAIPDTLSGTTFNLTVHPDSVHFKAGPYANVWRERQ